MVAFAPSDGTTSLHNGGDSSGWGTGNQTGNGFNPQGQSIEESESGPLISQMAALPGITSVRIELVINGVAQEAIIADATTKTDVLPKIKIGDKVSGRAYIYIADAEPRVAELDQTEIALHNTLKFKVPYNYECYDYTNTLVAQGTYYARDGIHLEAVTQGLIAGWQCVEDGTTHYGGYVSGLRGDVTLNAVTANGAPVLSASASPAVLFATAVDSDQRTITITGVTGTPTVSSISSLLEPQGTFVIDQNDSTKYTLTVKIKEDPQSSMGDPIWFTDSTTANISITDDNGIPTSVALTLKNRYTVTAVDANNTPHNQVNIDEGTQYTFTQMKSMIQASAIPANRQIVAFEEVGGNQTFEENDFPITFGSSTFNHRLIRLKAKLDFGMTTKNAENAAWTSNQTHAYNGNTGPLYVLEKNSTTTKELHITVTDSSANSNLSVTKDLDTQNFLQIDNSSLSSTGTSIIKLTSNVTHDSIGPNYIYPITITDSGTGISKVIFVKVAQPPAEYTYSLYFRKVDGTLVPIGTNQNISFIPGETLFTTPITMGDFDSTLSPLEASYGITGWKIYTTKANADNDTNGRNYGPAGGFDSSYCDPSAYTAIMVANTDIGVFYSNCRTSSNTAVAGDVVLSNGLCVDKTYYTGNTSTLSPYVVGTVCTRGTGNDQKFVVAKNPSNNTNLTWSNVTVNIGGLQVAVTGTDLQIGILPTYDLNEAGLSFSSDSSGKDSLSTLLSAGQNVDDYPAFKYCKDYKPTGVTTGSYSSDWYLPSLAEAYAIHQQLNTFPSGFVDTQLWLTTSNQNNQYYFWYTQGSSITPGLGNITTISKGYTSTDFQVYPCHEFSFTAPPQ